MDEQMRYVTRRKNRDGTFRYYWQRRGHDLKRLSDNPIQRFNEQVLYNQKADEGVRANIEGSVDWVIEKFVNGDDYGELSDQTRRIYDRWIREYSTLFGVLPFGALSKKVVVDLFDKMEAGYSTKVHAQSVLDHLFKIAIYHDFVQHNWAQGLKLGKKVKRTQCWHKYDDNPDFIGPFLESCKIHKDGEAIALAFNILLHSAQRPGDVVTMKWNQYDGANISVRQQKSNKLMKIPCPAALKDVLDITAKKGTVMIVSKSGRAMSQGMLNRRINEIKASIGADHLQARDLRRTAAVKLAEAGCSNRQIASITGHSVDSVQGILETYTPTNFEIATGAIKMLDKYELRTKESNALDSYGHQTPGKQRY